ncbi:MAG: carboxylesterase [Burkholderiaceae bacterium]|nr:MAG: carboxylesterase [Burkholderiaceae bacterium]
MSKSLAGWRAALVLALGAWLGASAVAAEAGPRVRVAQGRIEGITHDGVDAFLGIPYARPPVGEQRWRAPEAPAPWTGVRPARAVGAACMQDAPRPWGPFTTEFVDVQAPLSEDCLFLNVWTPHARGPRPLPVIVWIHGGGFGSGAASVPIYDGARLASRGAVVVGINYRLGIFGFLAHPELSAESPLRVSGNYGLLDMIAALRWVRANVSRFGGRSDQVTIAGQSAGAAAVLDLLAAPDARGLFSAAIAMSGAGMGVGALPLADAQAQGAALVREAGIASVSELRQLPADKVLAIRPRVDMSAGMPRLLFAPVVDGRVLPHDVEATGDRFASAVPVISGYMADEGFVMGPPSATPASFEAHVRQRYGAAAERFLAAYPHADEAQATRSMREIGRDRYMASLVMWAQRRAHAGQAVYGYLYSRAIPGPDAQRFGAFHTGEVPYLFGTLDERWRPYGEADRRVSAALQQQWLAFARGERLPSPWAPLQGDEPRVTELGEVPPTPVTAISDPSRLQVFLDYVAAGGRLSMF